MLQILSLDIVLYQEILSVHLKEIVHLRQIGVVQIFQQIDFVAQKCSIGSTDDQLFQHDVFFQIVMPGQIDNTASTFADLPDNLIVCHLCFPFA